MKKNLRYWAGAAVGVVAAIGFTSCAYDPYYSSTSVGGSYSSGSGYGDGYGYGGSTFSTSIFVGTGDPQWGYDPYNYSYYDYHRRCYYDPYLYGYYPVGYRPPIVYGVPHPYGWRPGGGYIRPPSRVYNGTVSNYRDRAGRYRSSDYGWAKQVRSGSVESGRVQGQRPPQGSSDRRNSQISNVRPNNGSREASNRYDNRESQARNTNNYANRQNSRPATRPESNARIPSRYNTPVADPRTQAQARQGQRNVQGRPPAQQNRQQAQQNAQRPPQKNNKQNNKAEEGENRIRGYR